MQTQIRPNRKPELTHNLHPKYCPLNNYNFSTGYTKTTYRYLHKTGREGIQYRFYTSVCIIGVVLVLQMHTQINRCNISRENLRFPIHIIHCDINRERAEYCVWRLWWWNMVQMLNPRIGFRALHCSCTHNALRARELLKVSLSVRWWVISIW